MIRSCSVFVLVALQIISGLEIEPPDEPEGPYSADNPRQGPLMHPYQEQIPRHCWAPPPGISPYDCCPMPKLFKDEEMVACGVQKPPEDVPRAQSRPHRDCNRTLCLLQSRNITNAGVIDYEKFRAFIDDWQTAHPDFAEAIGIAKKICVVEGGPEGPPHICEADRIFFCLTSNIIWNCKLNEDTKNCQILKEHMDECRPFYKKPEDQESKP